MQSISKLILISAIIVLAPVGFALAKGEDTGVRLSNSVGDEIKESCAKEFNAIQMTDPNKPCYEQFRARIDEKAPEGMYYDRSLAVRHKDEFGGGHVMTSIEMASDTVSNVYQVPTWKSSLPAVSGASPESGSGGDQKSGTD